MPVVVAAKVWAACCVCVRACSTSCCLWQPALHFLACTPCAPPVPSLVVSAVRACSHACPPPACPGLYTQVMRIPHEAGATLAVDDIIIEFEKDEKA